MRPLDLNVRPIGDLPLSANDEQELPVAATFSSLQAAADAARGGDLVAVLKGHYAGFVVDDRPNAGDDRYVYFKAMGGPGDVTIDAPARTDGDRWMVLIRAAHHIVLEGFNIAGTDVPGAPRPNSPWAGIMLDGDFARSSRLTHHVVILGNYSHNHRTWGLHSTDTRTVLLQDNVFALSAKEHSAYISDGSDDYVIRRNIFYGSQGSGLQCNLDPEASIGEVLRHPAFGGTGSRTDGAFAKDVLRRADALFGPRNYPDGKGENFIIEDNVINGVGRGGGAAINLAGLSTSLIQNNLIYGNLAHGIAQWDNDNPYDRALETGAEHAALTTKGPEFLPQFGCHDNVIRNNTVVMNNAGRAAFQAVHGSHGSAVINNILINDAPTSIEVSRSSLYRFTFGPNVVQGLSMPRDAAALSTLPNAAQSAFGIRRERLAREVHHDSEVPWILCEGPWWKFNPLRPDFHPHADSPLLAGRADARALPTHDLEGARRTTADIGAYVAR